MSSPQSSTPNSGFQSRLNRVAERRAPIEANRPVVDVLPDWRENARGPAGIVAAVVVGMISAVLVRIGLFHFSGKALVSDTPDVTLAIEMAGGLALSFLIFLLLPWKGIQYRFLQFAGVAVVALTMHNMVHKAPGLFGLAFSPDWTARVIAETEPGSMYVRGQSIPFAGKIREVATEETETEVTAEAAQAASETPAAGPQATAAAEEKPELPRRIVVGQ